MIVRTLAGLGTGIAPALAILLGMAVPGVASAGVYKCEDRFLDAIDEMQLRSAALKVLPKAVHLDEVAPCRNPDSAHARISTKKIQTVEGVQQWYEFTCRREAQPWKCDAPEFNQSITLSLDVNSVSRLVALSFDGSVSLARARVLSQEALEIYLDRTVRLPQCEIGGVKKSDLVDLRHGNLPAAEAPIDVNVNREETAEVVWLRDVDVEIQFPSVKNRSDADEMCWNALIIVA